MFSYSSRRHTKMYSKSIKNERWFVNTRVVYENKIQLREIFSSYLLQAILGKKERNINLLASISPGELENTFTVLGITARGEFFFVCLFVSCLAMGLSEGMLTMNPWHLICVKRNLPGEKIDHWFNDENRLVYYIPNDSQLMQDDFKKNEWINKREVKEQELEYWK